MTSCFPLAYERNYALAHSYLPLFKRQQKMAFRQICVVLLKLEYKRKWLPV